jgi:hypothetical protein
MAPCERQGSRIGLDRLGANNLRSRLRGSAFARSFGDFIDQPSPDSREHMVLATARTKDRRLRPREFLVVGSVYFNAGGNFVPSGRAHEDQSPHGGLLNFDTPLCQAQLGLPAKANDNSKSRCLPCGATDHPAGAKRDAARSRRLPEVA